MKNLGLYLAIAALFILIFCKGSIFGEGFSYDSSVVYDPYYHRLLGSSLEMGPFTPGDIPYYPNIITEYNDLVAPGTPPIAPTANGIDAQKYYCDSYQFIMAPSEMGCGTCYRG